MSLLENIRGTKECEKTPEAIFRLNMSERLEKVLQRDSGKEAVVLPDPPASTDPHLEEALHSIHAAQTEALAELRATQQQIQAERQSRLEDYRKQVAGLSSTVEKLSHQSSEIQTVAQGVARELAKNAQELLTRSAAQLQQHVDATAAACAAARQGIEPVKKQMEALVTASLESLTKAMERCLSQVDRALTERTELARKSADTAVNSIHAAAREASAQLQASGNSRAQSATEDQSKQLAGLSGAIAEIRSDLGALVEKQLAGHVQPVFQKAVVEAAEKLEAAAQEALQRSTRQLQEQAEAAAISVKQLESARQNAVADTEKEITAVAKTSLESATKATIDEYRHELALMAHDYLLRSLREIEAGQPDLLKQQQQAMEKKLDEYLKTHLEEHLLFKARSVPKRQKPKSWRGLALGLTLLMVSLTSVVAYYAARTEPQLRAEPPASFVDEHPEWNGKKRAKEQELARAYWNVAVQNVQQRYPYGTPLPDQPPEEFRAEDKDSTDSTTQLDPASRARYWEKLRRLWSTPAAWQETRWNFTWLYRAAQWVDQKTSRYLGS